MNTLSKNIHITRVSTKAIYTPQEDGDRPDGWTNRYKPEYMYPTLLKHSYKISKMHGVSTHFIFITYIVICYQSVNGLGGSLDAPSDWTPGGRGFNPRRGRQHSFMEIDHEIFSTVILSLPLIQEGQLSVSGERMCTILVNR